MSCPPYFLTGNLNAHFAPPQVTHNYILYQKSTITSPALHFLCLVPSWRGWHLPLGDYPFRAAGVLLGPRGIRASRGVLWGGLPARVCQKYRLYRPWETWSGKLQKFETLPIFLVQMAFFWAFGGAVSSLFLGELMLPVALNLSTILQVAPGFVLLTCFNLGLCLSLGCMFFGFEKMIAQRSFRG